MMKEEAVEKPRRSDPYIWGIIIILYIVSVVEVYSAISREITGGDVYSPIIKHALLLFSGFLITYATSRVHYKWFKVMAYLMIPATIVLLVSILLWGDTLNGAKRTIPVMGISLQGSEVAKVTIVLAMATVLAKSQIKRGVNTKGVVLVVVLVTIFSGLLFTQGLTNTLLFIGISVCMMLIGGVEWYKLGIIFLAYLVLALAVMQAKDILTESELFNKQAQTEQTAQAGEQVEQKKVLIQRSSTWKSRLEDFFDSTPEYEKETTDANRQEHRAAMAMAHGGITGVGPGNSREASRLPLAFSDYIYAIIIEDLGFVVGGVGLLLVYLMILARAGLIARRCTKAFPALLVMGMAMMIVLQALFNMAIVVGVFPVSGQPLPLISKGGTSIWMMSFAFGVMLSVSRYAVKDTGTNIKSERESGLPEDLQAANPTNLA
ncbi:FtsW/RodA/SpoVE family cell cycle protein [Barnesiella viscericola]|uniref:FtsW/RodA/SpoVE family cell cycle protein n=1 Tax=Barnesiella viscericola TaxID=397865 RepID=UPI0025A364ED|nr:FtsW/RodA/SpoVE family cell cycle protein [Barnesiella viscericola]MDM8269444.1 FtsW/RodA/SpoVE family cell cycle protein [Barnesiella viscericola]